MRCFAMAFAIGVVSLLLPAPASAAGLGVPFGTRDPVVCPSVDVSRTPTPGEAADLIRCRLEVESGGELWLMKDVAVRLGAGRPFDILSDITMKEVDVSRPVHDVRGSFTWSQCIPRSSAQSYGKDPDRNCTERVVPAATGGCWRTTFGEWGSTLGGAVTEIRPGMPPLR